MTRHKIFDMAFSKVYPMYVAKAERKERTKEEVDEIIRWLTGYSQDALLEQIERDVSFDVFFEEAPHMNPHRDAIKGVICGVRVEEIDDPLMKAIRQLDKMIDELAKGKTMEKILRNN